VIDQFDVLYADSRKHPRVMGVPLHPISAARHRPQSTRGCGLRPAARS
jgi:hypothetical protein